MKGEYYTFTDEDLPRYAGSEHVFGVGNVVTGQGNIRVSLIHSQKVTKHLLENYLNRLNADGAPMRSAAEARGAGEAQAVLEKVQTLPASSASEVDAIERRIRDRQERAGYTGDYDSWIKKVTPPDLE
jgi:hypothetical protein